MGRRQKGREEGGGGRKRGTERGVEKERKKGEERGRKGKEVFGLLWLPHWSNPSAL